MNALFSVLGVMGSNLDQSQGMNPENDVSTKKVEFGENSVIYSQLLALRKDVFSTVLVSVSNYLMMPWSIPWELEAQTWSKRKV